MPRPSLPTLAAITLTAALATAGTVAAAALKEPTLVGRALLPPDASAPAPFGAVRNAEPAPQAGARQPVGGFSALIDAKGKDTFWAMPDNGFGSKANSESFLLRVYRVHADLETARDGSGEVEILDWITLSDPDEKIPFEIVNEGTQERLLTGGDFDLESMRVARDGTLWFGEEFGPFLVGETGQEGSVGRRTANRPATAVVMGTAASRPAEPTSMAITGSAADSVPAASRRY